MGRPRPIDFRMLRRMVRPEQALTLHGWRPTWRQGPLARGRCLFHGSTHEWSRTFLVTQELGHCFRCGWHGDALAIFAQLEGLEVLPAAYQLCREFGLEIPYL